MPIIKPAAILILATSAISSAQVIATTSAPQAGSTLSNGAYVCNPAHSYPAGQTCVDGPTPTLSYISSSSSTKTTVPQAGQTLSNGAYVCNPAHSYPAGQTCIDGPTPTLSFISSTASSSSSSSSSATTSTPKAGQTLSNGAYVCNPAHSYPAGQTCVDGATPTLSSVATSATAGGAATTSTSTGMIATYSGGAVVVQYARPAAMLVLPVLAGLF